LYFAGSVIKAGSVLRGSHSLPASKRNEHARRQSAAERNATQCSACAALKNNEPLTPERNRSELAALEAAGYNPFLFDQYYPDDVQAAQRQVDRWY
jgi:hypothetical protein